MIEIKEILRRMDAALEGFERVWIDYSYSIRNPDGTEQKGIRLLTTHVQLDSRTFQISIKEVYDHV